MPRTFETTVYKFDELSPEAQERAIEKWRNDTIRNGDYSWLNEIHESFKALFNLIKDPTLIRYSIDYSNRSQSWCSVRFYHNEVGYFTGPRAMAWLENNLLSYLRLPDKYRARWKESSSVRQAGNSYGYRTGKAGEIESCPFTGVCFDDDLLNALVNNVKSGMTLKDSFQDLADVAGRLGEAEIEYETSDEYIRETLTDSDFEFTEDGEMI